MPTDKPAFCPLCGDDVSAVRHVAGNIYELQCENEQCLKPCVVLVDDMVKIAT